MLYFLRIKSACFTSPIEVISYECVCMSMFYFLYIPSLWNQVVMLHFHAFQIYMHLNVVNRPVSHLDAPIPCSCSLRKLIFIGLCHSMICDLGGHWGRNMLKEEVKLVL